MENSLGDISVSAGFLSPQYIKTWLIRENTCYHFLNWCRAMETELHWSAGSVSMQGGPWAHWNLTKWQWHGQDGDSPGIVFLSHRSWCCMNTEPRERPSRDQPLAGKSQSQGTSPWGRWSGTEMLIIPSKNKWLFMRHAPGIKSSGKLHSTDIFCTTEMEKTWKTKKNCKQLP